MNYIQVRLSRCFNWFTINYAGFTTIDLGANELKQYMFGPVFYPFNL